MSKKAAGQWVNILELPPGMILDGLRVRYKRRILGHIRSAWNKGIWLTDKPQEFGRITPWFPPEGSLKDAAPNLFIEVKQ